MEARSIGIGPRHFVGCALVVAALAGVSSAARGASPVVADRISALVEAVDAGTARVGVHVVSLQTGAQVYAHDAGALFKPASNMKVITSTAALGILGTKFTYRTVLGVRGDDLIVIGSGDPSFGDPKLAEEAGEPITAAFHGWAAALKARGIREIRGDLVFDDTVFESKRYHPSWPANQRHHWYSAPVGGLNFNDNCIDVEVAPGSGPGSAAAIRVVPGNTYTDVRNEAKTGGKQAVSIRRLGDDPVYVVSGTVARKGTLQSIAVPDPGMLFASALRTSLAAKGIKIHGELRRARVRDDRGGVPSEVTVIGVCERSLPDLLGRLNKNSQNLFAECLLKTIGFHESVREHGHGEGSYATGERYVRRYLKRIGAPDLDTIVIEDGSGLSHGNRVTPRLLTRVMLHTARNGDGAVFLASLAVAGEDGTLRRRMRDIEGQVRAKTGYISGVHALSGFARSKSGVTYVFSILVNEVKASGAKKLQDDICRVLVNEG
jgi:D-alanyl-D-alanine carboxypeptidase/D-alanyl-D-alanine-endopeptidase (penicillin-binding protein 4)